MPGGPPRAEGVLEQEPDHVVLGEQLGHRPEVRAADLALGGVDLVLLVLLPELVHPAQRVVGSERLCRDGVEDLLQCVASLRARGAAGRTGHRAGRSREGSPRRSGRRRTTRRARPARPRAPRTRRASPAPGTAGAAAGRSRRGTARTAAGATARTRTPRRAGRGRCPTGATSRASPLRSAACVGIEVFRTPVGEHAEALDGSARRRLRRTTGGEHRRLKLLSEGGGQGAHGWPQMITVVPASRCGCTSARSCVEVRGEIVAGLERWRTGALPRRSRLELLGGPLTCLVAAAGDEADPVGPRAEGDGVERFEQLRLGAHVRRRRRDELRLGDDGVTIGGVELVPLWPCFELGDRGALGVGELLVPAGSPRRAGRWRAR